MSSKTVTTNDQNLSCDDEINDRNEKSPSAHRLTTSSHHVRHHSYDTTSNKLAAQLFPSARSNRRENHTNQTHHGHFLPLRSSHRHTSSYASDQSSFNNLNSNHYRQNNQSASQENLFRKNSILFCCPRTNPSRMNYTGKIPKLLETILMMIVLPLLSFIS